MARSKTIKLFLIDGEPTGRIKCSLANWTGIAYKIPSVIDIPESHNSEFKDTLGKTKGFVVFKKMENVYYGID